MKRKNYTDQTPSPEPASSPVRDRLIEVAARHFAEHGQQGASQRAIQREVGVNPSTVNYYFGSKDLLYLAVIEDALSLIQKQRLDLLMKIPENLPAKQHNRELLEAYIAPHILGTKTERGYNYARILARLLLVTPTDTTEIVEEYVHPVREKYVDSLSKIFPAVSRNRIYEVLRMSVGLMAMAPIRVGIHALTDKAIDQMVSDVVEFAAIGFETLCVPNND